MNSKTSLFAIFRLPLPVLLLFGAVACSLSTPSGTTATIYVAGSYNNGTGTAACYWLNGTLTPLETGGMYPAFATSIYVSGSDIYVSGYYKNGNNVACYWKNGGRTDLTTTGTNAQANSIFVSGGTIYTAGFYFPPGTRTAAYWVGTTVNNLPTNTLSSGNAIANSIFVDGSTIYIAGKDNMFNTSPAYAVYWTVNGTTTETVPSTATASTANSIFATSGTVYTAGWDTPALNAIAKYWTDNSETSLGLTDGSANSIFYSNGTLYIAGQYQNQSSNPIAFYWNGTETDLLGPNGAAASTIAGGINALSVYVSGGTAYVAGSYGSPTTASYWTITGSTFSQKDLPGTGGVAAAIFVQ
jgi:hypothetical protein